MKSLRCFGVAAVGMLLAYIKTGVVSLSCVPDPYFRGWISKSSA
jgi:hypothetical protein